MAGTNADRLPQIYSSRPVEGQSKTDVHVQEMWKKTRYAYQINGDMIIAHDGNQTQQSRNGWFKIDGWGVETNYVKGSYVKRRDTTRNVQEGDMIVLSRISYQRSPEVVPGSDQKAPGYEYQLNVIGFDKEGRKIANYPIVAILAQAYHKINNPDEIFESTQFHKNSDWKVYFSDKDTTAIEKWAQRDDGR